MVAKGYYMRRAIAMIELIFAIVIMGIVFTAAPMLISTATQSSYVAIQQESINEVASQVNIIMGYQWDENNTDITRRATILHTSGDSNLSDENLTGRRYGTPNVSYRSFLTSTGLELNASAIGEDGSGEIKDDIDDFHGTTYLIEVQAASDKDYIDTNISIDNNISYISDAVGGGTYNDPGADNTLTFSSPFSAAAPGGTTNIKHISVTLTSSSGVDEYNKTITLHAFSCNLGSYELEEQ